MAKGRKGYRLNVVYCQIIGSLSSLQTLRISNNVKYK